MKNINKNRSFPNLPVRQGLGNLPLSESFVKEELSSYFIKQVEDPRQKPSGMTSLFSVKAFTLIELLVVVLIIGILAAAALPQYQKAVEKSRATQAITLLRSVYNAAKEYQLANGEWPTSFDELSVEIPWTGTRNGVGLGLHKQGKSNADWSIQLRNDGASSTARGLVVTRLSGPYAYSSFQIFAVPKYSPLNAEELLCVEMVQDGFQKTKGSYCKKIMKATQVRTNADGAWNFFRIP